MVHVRLSGWVDLKGLSSDVDSVALAEHPVPVGYRVVHAPAGMSLLPLLFGCSPVRAVAFAPGSSTPVMFSAGLQGPWEDEGGPAWVIFDKGPRLVDTSKLVEHGLVRLDLLGCQKSLRVERLHVTTGLHACDLSIPCRRRQWEPFCPFGPSWAPCSRRTSGPLSRGARLA